MGWQSSGDPMQGTHIFFKTKEDAIHFAEKQGTSPHLKTHKCFVAYPQRYQATNGLLRNPMRELSGLRLMLQIFTYGFATLV